MLMDPITGSALVGAGASLLGNLFNFGSQSKANAANLKIAQMNNQFNERMMEKQMAYNTDMFNKQNEWNSASSQRKRLEQAGLNPYLMMTGGNAGTAANTLGVTAATAAPASVVAPQLDSSSIGESVRNIISASATKESNDNLRMLTKTGYDLANYEKALKRAMAEDYRKSRDVKEQEKQRLARLNELEDINYNSLNTEYIMRNTEQYFRMTYQREQAVSMILKNAFDIERLPYAKIFASNEAALQAAEISLKYLQGKLSKAQAKEAMANVTLIGKKVKGQDNENKLFEKTFDETVGAVKANQKYLNILYTGWSELGSDYYKYTKPISDGGKVLAPVAKSAGSIIKKGK